MPGRFEGLGVFLDTFDNAPGRHSRRFPYISGRFHAVPDPVKPGENANLEGARTYEHNSHEFAHTMDAGDGCSEAFRSADGRRGAIGPKTLTLRLEYEGPPAGPDGARKGGILAASVLLAEGRRQSDSSPAHTWKQCFVLRGVTLPPGLFLGFSASTGDLTDAHELDRVRVYAPQAAPLQAAGLASLQEGDEAVVGADGRADPLAAVEAATAAARCRDQGPLCGVESEAEVDAVVREAASIRALAASVDAVKGALQSRGQALQQRVEEGAARLQETLSRLQRTEEELEGQLDALRERASQVERGAKAEARRRGSLWEVGLGVAVAGIGVAAGIAVHLACQAHERLAKVHSM